MSPVASPRLRGYNSLVEKDLDGHFGKPHSFSFGKLRIALVGEPTASNRRDGVGGLTCRGRDYMR